MRRRNYCWGGIDASNRFYLESVSKKKNFRSLNKGSWEKSRNNILNKASCFLENKFIFIMELFPKVHCVDAWYRKHFVLTNFFYAAIINPFHFEAQCWIKRWRAVAAFNTKWSEPAERHNRMDHNKENTPQKSSKSCEQTADRFDVELLPLPPPGRI